MYSKNDRRTLDDLPLPDVVKAVGIGRRRIGQNQSLPSAQYLW